MKLARSGFRLWLLAFAGFFLLQAAWAFALPYDGPADEQAHGLRAAAVVHGELLAPSDSVQLTPNSLFRHYCFEMKVEVAADCAKEPGGDSTMTPHKVGAAAYNPVYYALAGWPLRFWPNWTGILLTRLLTGAAIAALLAAAVVSACRWTRHRGVLAGLLVAISPMAISLGGAINPNGVEVAGGVALFAGLIPLLLEPRPELNRPAVILSGIAASVLVTPRGLGVMWLGVVGVSVLIGSTRPHVRALLRERLVRVWLAVTAVSVVAALAWDVVARPLGTPAPADLGMTTTSIIKTAFLDVWPNIANQLVGIPGWSEVLEPRLVYVVWFMAVGLVLLGGFTLGARRQKLQLLLLFVGTFVPMLAWEMLWANQGGWFSQGRYFLAAAVGLPILGAYTMARRGLTPVNMRAITRALVVLLIPIQPLVLVYTMCRYESGLSIMHPWLASLNPLNGSWKPPLGPVLPPVLSVLGAVALFLMYWRASRLPESPPDTPAELMTTPLDELGTERVLSSVS